MIISHCHRFIFVHVAKTAGTSITAALDHRLRWNDLILGGTPFGESIQPHYRERFNMNKHSTAAEIREIVGKELWDRYFCFSFVRNPYSRVLSLYTWIQKLVNDKWVDRCLRFFPEKIYKPHEMWTWPLTHAFLKSNNFSEFIRNENFLKGNISDPQVNWIFDHQGKCIVDFVGRFERLEEDFSMVAKHIGLDVKIIHHKNRSHKHLPLQSYFSEDDYRYLADLYQIDFKTFEYDPDLRF